MSDLDFDLARLDPLVHSRIRLAILAILYRGNNPSFKELKRALKLTDGNLGANLKQLEDAGIIKSTRQKSMNPIFKITPHGSMVFSAYMEAFIELIKGAVRHAK